MEKNKKSRGGFREGAGRLSENLKAITIYVTSETKSILDVLSKDLGISKGKVVDELTKSYLEMCEKEGQ